MISRRFSKEKKIENALPDGKFIWIKINTFDSVFKLTIKGDTQKKKMKLPNIVKTS